MINARRYSLTILVALVALHLAACQRNRLTSEQIIALCADAAGGRDAIDRVKTLRVHAVYPDHGENALILDVQLPNLTFNPQANLVFDGEKLCFLKGRNQQSAPIIVDAEEWKDGDLDIAFAFPAFYSYSAQYLGLDSLDRRLYHKLAVTLPLGAEMVYWIDALTYLPMKAVGKLTMHGQVHAPVRIYSDYREVDGVYLPFGFTYGSRHGQIQGWVEKFEINPVFPDGHFKIPEF